MAARVVSVGVTDVQRDPDPNSEVVTQALMNAPVEATESVGDWTHARLSDYEGWIRTDKLEEPIVKGFSRVGDGCGTALPLVAVITATHTFLYEEAEGQQQRGKVYLSSVLPVLDTTHERRVQVALPGERDAWIECGDLDVRLQHEAFPRRPVRVVTDYARRFLGVPYLWGGTSWEGLDCSGFVQLCYRMGGYIIPRDADQQHDFLTYRVERGAMREGDLIFFGTKSITHVALALNEREYIHSEGQNYDRVLINSFDSRAPHYYPRLDEILWGIKRVAL